MRISLRHRIVALSLASLYCVVAAFGYSLHALTDSAEASKCGAAAVCCCCASKAPVTAAGWSVASPGHDADDCAICSLLSQMRMGRQAPVATLDRSEAVLTVTPPVRSILAARTIRLGDSRGPPVA